MIGFVIQTKGTAIRMLTRKIIANNAAITIWNGKGINAQNNPTAIAPEHVFLLMCHKEGLCKTSPKIPTSLLFIMVSGFGKQFLMSFFGILILVVYFDSILIIVIKSND